MAVLEKRESRVGPRPKVILLDARTLQERCRQSHIRPSPDLAPSVDVAWILQWTLEPNEAFVQRVIPDPCVQIFVEPNSVQVQGVVTGAYSTRLSGTGFVLGFKFRPAGFFPFCRRPVAELTNQKLPLCEVLPDGDSGRLQRHASRGDSKAIVEELERVLRGAWLEPEPAYRQASNWIDRIISDPETLTVERAARDCGVSVRVLQRMFRTYAGVSPKWLIRRCRLQEASARVESEDDPCWSDLALRLGYFDQAHFIRDFTKFAGKPPGAHANSIRR